MDRGLVVLLVITQSLINAVNYAEKNLETCRESGDRVEEYLVSKVLAEMYFRQSKYTKK